MSNTRLSTTSTGVSKDTAQRDTTKEKDRALRRIVGMIKDINSKKNGKLYISVLVPDGRGGMRLFGQGKTDVVIVDSPLDILQRFGGLKPGQVVEIFYRGINETGQGSARIIGENLTDFVNAREAPKEGFKVASSLPFEPGGII